MKKYIIYLEIMSSLFTFSVHPSNTITITQPDEYVTQVLQAQQPVVVKFWAPWCTVCQSINQPWQEIKQHKEFCDTITFIDINIDEAPVLCEQQDIKGIPTFKFIEHGRAISKDEIGVKNIDEFKNTLCTIIRQAFEIGTENNKEPYKRPEWQNTIINSGKQASMVLRELTRKSITTTLTYTTYFLDWIKHKVDIWLC